MAQICRCLRLHGGFRRLHGAQRLFDRQRDQRGLRQQEHDRHLHPRRGHRRAVHDQGARHLRPKRVALAYRQPHRRRQSARRVRQAAQRGHRLLLRPPFDRIHRAPLRGRRGRNAGHQPIDHLAWPRSLVADRAGDGDGHAGPVNVVHQLCGGAARVPGAAQTDPPRLPHSARAIPRRHPHHRNAAGNAAGHPHRQGFHARRHDARSLRPQRRRGRTRSQQYGARLRPRQPADGNAGRLRDRHRHHLWRLSRDRNRGDARTVLFLHRRLPAGL